MAANLDPVTSKSYTFSFLIFVALCPGGRVCMYCVPRMTSSNPSIYSRGAWATSGLSYAAEPRRCLLASFTYNNIQVHSPLPNTHTQTIHGMLNSISLSARLCAYTRVCVCVFVSGPKKRQVSLKDMSSSLSVVSRVFQRRSARWYNGIVGQNQLGAVTFHNLFFFQLTDNSRAG